jgi:hypothetical protein
VSLCLASAVLALSLGVDHFTLRWTHSVERSEWVEHWRIDGADLVLQDAQVRGSGAGMEPPEGSVLKNGWWVYRADRRLPVLLLAVSGATGRGWQLCTELGCKDLEALLALGGPLQSPIHLSAATRCRPVAD